MQKRPSSFEEWINQLGVHQVARTIGVTATTVRNWRRGAYDPELNQVRKIRRVSLLTYEQIIDRTPARGARE